MPEENDKDFIFVIERADKTQRAQAIELFKQADHFNEDALVGLGVFVAQQKIYLTFTVDQAHTDAEQIQIFFRESTLPVESELDLAALIRMPKERMVTGFAPLALRTLEAA